MHLAASLLNDWYFFFHPCNTVVKEAKIVLEHSTTGLKRPNTQNVALHMSCRYCGFWGQTSELKFGVFDREELHQVRPDWHHGHGDGTQSGNAACAGSAGRPAHPGAEKEGTTTLTSSLKWSQQDGLTDCSPEILQASLWISCCFHPQSSGEHPFLPRLSSICNLEALAVPGPQAELGWCSSTESPAPASLCRGKQGRHVGSHLSSHWGKL